MKAIEIFKAGKHVDMSGVEHTVTVADLEATAKAYSPSFHEAPFVIGHPKTNHPAYGWAEKLTVEGDRLIAHPKQVNAEFAELVESGAYKKRSSSFYTPDNVNNPVPGTWYLRHVGFLGAQPPVVKGLKDVEFAEGDGFVEFSENNSHALKVITRLLSGIRDLFIEKNGTEAADRTLPSWDLNYLRELANEPDQPISSFSEPEPPSVTPPQSQPTKGDDMSEALQQQLAAEKAAREKAENELTALKTAQAKAAAIATEKANAEFAEGLINEGKLLPKHADKVKALLNGAPVTADFAEGKESYLDALKGYLSDSPKVVDFSEAAKKGAQATDATADYAEGTDPASIELDQKITAYMAEHKVDYNTAFARVAN